MDELRAIVIGCGYAGEQHAKGFAQASGSSLSAVCDLNEARALTLATKANVPAYTSFEEALVSERPDIVSIATDEYHHDELCVQALEAGAHVFCEKIMAHSLEAGKHMVDTARRTGRTLGVNYNYRHVPAYKLIKENIQMGELSSPRLIVAHTHAYLWHHTLDLLRFFLGEPTSVQASLREDAELRQKTYHWKDHERLLYIPSDHVSAIFHFPSGAVANLSSSAWIPFDEHWFSFSIYTQNTAVHINHAIATNLIGRSGPGFLSQTLSELPPFTVDDSFQASLAAFIEAVRSGQEPAVTGEDGLAVMQMEAAVAQAAQRGTCIPLER